MKNMRWMSWAIVAVAALAASEAAQARAAGSLDEAQRQAGELVAEARARACADVALAPGEAGPSEPVKLSGFRHEAFYQAAGGYESYAVAVQKTVRLERVVPDGDVPKQAEIFRVCLTEGKIKVYPLATEREYAVESASHELIRLVSGTKQAGGRLDPAEELKKAKRRKRA